MSVERIFELKGDDFEKGLSQYSEAPKGGLFRSASNIDFINTPGMLKATFSASDLDVSGTTVTKAIKQFVGYSSSGTPYFYGYADGGGSTALYSVNATTGSVSDVSAQITTSSSSARGAIDYQGYLVYARNTEIRSRIIPVSGGTDTQILTGLTDGDHPLFVGFDFLYGVDGGANANKVFRITNVTGTSGNSLNVFSFESGFTIRDGTTDGRFLVLIGDNSTGAFNTMARAQVQFWDTAKGMADVVWEFPEQRLYSVEKTDWGLIVHGEMYTYACNAATPPKIIANHSIGSNIPIGASQERDSKAKFRNQLLWSNATKIYSMGSFPGSNSVVFAQPFSVSSGTITAVAANKNMVFAATDSNKLFRFSSGNASSDIYLSRIPLTKPYKFAYARLVLRSPISSGQSVTSSLNVNDDNRVVYTNVVFNNTNSPGKQAFIITEQSGDAFSPRAVFMEDIGYLYLALTGGAAIHSFTIYGTPIDPQIAV